MAEKKTGNSVLYFTESDNAFTERLGKELKGLFSEGEKIAVKLHMGERENPNHLKPEFVKIVVGVLQDMGARPFLFDSPVMYNSDRHEIEGYEKQNQELGFTEEALGCPVVVSNDFVEVKGRRMKYQVCRHLADADGVLVLTHFKGHACSGIGGSIKNLGMGGLSRESKRNTHMKAKPVLSGECILCRKCLEVCSFGCIEYSESGPCFDYDGCYGCSKCIQNCPQNCLKPRLAEFDKLLADGAVAALSTFSKSYFVNVIRNITNRCDCQRSDVSLVLADIGILIGSDIVAIDSASLDLVNQKAGKAIFDEIWHKDSAIQIREAGRLGAGQTGYEIRDA